MAKNIESDASVESGSIQAPVDNIDRASLYEGVSKLGQDNTTTAGSSTANDALPHYDTKSLYGEQPNKTLDAPAPQVNATEGFSTAQGDSRSAGAPPSARDAEQAAAQDAVVGAPPDAGNAEQAAAQDAMVGAPPGAGNAEQAAAQDAVVGAPLDAGNAEQAAAQDAMVGAPTGAGNAEQASAQDAMTIQTAASSGGDSGDGKRDLSAVSYQDFNQAAGGTDVMGNQRGDLAGLPPNASHGRVQNFQAWSGSPEGMKMAGTSDQTGGQLDQQPVTAGLDQPHRGEVIHSPMGDMQPQPVDGAGDNAALANSGDASYFNIPPAWEQARALQTESTPYEHRTAQNGETSGYSLHGEPVNVTQQPGDTKNVVVQFGQKTSSDAPRSMNQSELDPIKLTNPVGADMSPMGIQREARPAMTDGAGNVYLSKPGSAEPQLSDYHKVVSTSDVQMLTSPGKTDEVAQARQSVIEQMKQGKQVDKQDVIALARTAPFYNPQEGMTESPFNATGGHENCMATTAAYMRTYATGKLTNDNDIGQLDRWDGEKLGAARRGNVGETEQDQLNWRDNAARSGLPDNSHDPIDGVKSLKMVTAPLGSNGAHSMIYIDMADGTSVLYDPQRDRQYCASVRDYVKRNSAN